LDEFLLAEGELETLDGPRGRLEAGVAVDAPVDRVEDHVLVARGADAVVADEVDVAEDDEAAAADAEGQGGGRGDAFGHGDDAEAVLGFDAGHALEIDAFVELGHEAQAVIAFAPGGGGGGGEHG